MKFKFDPNRAGMAKALGPLETVVMEFLWDGGPASVGEVQAALRERRALAYTTVLTILSRLKKKGLLHRSKVGNSHVYSPAMTRDEFSGRVVEGVVDGLLDAFSRPAVAYFVRRLSRGDEALLRDLERLLEGRAAEGDD